MDFNQRMNLLRTGFNKNKAEIMTGIGIAGFGASLYLAIKATVKATRKIDAEKKELGVEDLAFKRKFMLCWKDYIFPFATAAASAAIIIKSDSIKAKETSELLSAVVVSRSLLNDYKEAVEETISEKKKEQIEEKVAQKELDKAMSNPAVQVISTGNGNTLFIENLTGTVFRSSKDAVVRAIADAERRIFYDRYISLNELREELGLPGHAVGEMLGFDESTNNGKLDYSLDACEFEGELAWGIRFLVEPVSDYDMVYSR